MKKKVKIPVAIIGKNFGYKVLAKALSKTKRFELKALAFKSNKFKKNLERNILISSNWKNVIKNKNIKAVIIATPPSTHENIINFAIKHQKHIFCEKPCTLSFQQISKILKKIKQNKKFISHMINYELLEIGAFRYFSDLIRKKNIKVRSINVVWNILDRTKANNWKNHHNKGGGLIFNYFCHSLYYLEKLFGKINFTKSIGNFKLNKKNDFIEVILKLQNNIFCSVKITSTKFLKKNELLHSLFINTNVGNFLIKSKTLDISDQFSIDKHIYSQSKVVKKRIFYEKKNSQDFRIQPSFYNFKKFADSIERKKITTPNFLDAKNIHFLIKKTIQS